MPPLVHPHNTNSLTLPARQAAVIAETDVLVVGGGPAGLGAAIGAAQAGAEVILTERYGFLGGCATAALVMPMMSYYTWGPPSPKPCSLLYPSDHGPGKPVVAGALTKLVERLVERGGAIPPSLQTGYVVPFDPEIFKLAAFELLDEAGVKFLLHSLASGVIGEGKVEGAVFETKSGPVVIKAKVTIDCTGDGDIASFAGAPFEFGREIDGLSTPMTLMFRAIEFQRSGFERYVKEHPEQWRGVFGLWDLVQKARASGELELPRDDVLLFASPRDSEVTVNCTRITRVKGTDVWDLTYAEWRGRQQISQIAAFLNKYVPGFEKSYVAQSGVDVGVRATRRILGEYKLTENDVLGARKFEDVVARGAYPIDIHDPEGRGTTIKRLPPGEAYDIPLRALLPKKTDGLTVAGRCISGTYEAQASYRAMSICMATGQAAGVCSAIAARSQKNPRAVPASEVQAELLRQGANIRDLSI